MNDAFVSCPYNIKHRVPKSRLQAHLVKCQEKYPPLQICPYNATHRIPINRYKEHVASCPSKDSVFPEDVPPKVIATITTPRQILQKEYIQENDPNHEMWD